MEDKMGFMANIKQKVTGMFLKDKLLPVVRRLCDISGLEEDFFSTTEEIPVKGIRITIEEDEAKNMTYFVLMPGDGVKFAKELHFMINKMEKQINEAVYGSGGYSGSLSSGARVRYDYDDALKEFIKLEEDEE